MSVGTRTGGSTRVAGEARDMRTLGVGVTVSDGGTVVFVHGEIDLLSMSVFTQVVMDVVASGARVVVIDLSFVDLMTAAGVNVLNTAQNALLSQDRELRVVAPVGSAPARVLQVLRTATSDLTVFPTRASALAGGLPHRRRAVHAVVSSERGPDIA
jgi:anti-anti-sigma factor